MVTLLLLFFGFGEDRSFAVSSERVEGPVTGRLPTTKGRPNEFKGRKKLPEYTNSDFVVEGIVFHSDVGKRSAYIRLKGRDAGKVLRVGDGVGPFRLSVIEESSVTLYHVDRILILKLESVIVE